MYICITIYIYIYMYIPYISSYFNVEIYICNILQGRVFYFSVDIEIRNIYASSKVFFFYCFFWFYFQCISFYVFFVFFKPLLLSSFLLLKVFFQRWTKCPQWSCELERPVRGRSSTSRWRSLADFRLNVETCFFSFGY